MTDRSFRGQEPNYYKRRLLNRGDIFRQSGLPNPVGDSGVCDREPGNGSILYEQVTKPRPSVPEYPVRDTSQYYDPVRDTQTMLDYLRSEYLSDFITYDRIPVDYTCPRCGKDMRYVNECIPLDQDRPNRIAFNPDTDIDGEVLEGTIELEG